MDILIILMCLLAPGTLFVWSLHEVFHGARAASDKKWSSADVGWLGVFVIVNVFSTLWCAAVYSQMDWARFALPGEMVRASLSMGPYLFLVQALVLGSRRMLRAAGAGLARLARWRRG